MSFGSNNKICKWCKRESLVEGTLEGVSFKPLIEKKKWLSSGVYGIRAFVCYECGRISELLVDTKTLQKILKMKK